jgi:YVTN family beta-propeller protein
VSTIDVKTRTKNPTNIPVGPNPLPHAVTPDGKTVFAVDNGANSVSTIDVKTRTKNPTDIPVGPFPIGLRSRRTARLPSSPAAARAWCRQST